MQPERAWPQRQEPSQEQQRPPGSMISWAQQQSWRQEQERPSQPPSRVPRRGRWMEQEQQRLPKQPHPRKRPSVQQRQQRQTFQVDASLQPRPHVQPQRHSPHGSSRSRCGEHWASGRSQQQELLLQRPRAQWKKRASKSQVKTAQSSAWELRLCSAHWKPEQKLLRPAPI